MQLTYDGVIKTPNDAILIFEACRLGLLRLIRRRLTENERTAIRSGCVFAWDEQEAGMRRWTDGKIWSASRVTGSFLTYREMNPRKSAKKTISRSNSPSSDSTPDSGRNSPPVAAHSQDQPQEQPPLIKQSFSIVTSEKQKLHLISYISSADQNNQSLSVPSKDPYLSTIKIPPTLYSDSPHSYSPAPPTEHPRAIADSGELKPVSSPPFAKAFKSPSYLAPVAYTSSPPDGNVQPAPQPYQFHSGLSQHSLTKSPVDNSRTNDPATSPGPMSHFQVSSPNPYNPNSGSSARWGATRSPMNPQVRPNSPGDLKRQHPNLRGGGHQASSLPDGIGSHASEDHGTSPGNTYARLYSESSMNENAVPDVGKSARMRLEAAEVPLPSNTSSEDFRALQALRDNLSFESQN